MNKNEDDVKDLERAQRNFVLAFIALKAALLLLPPMFFVGVAAVVFGTLVPIIVAAILGLGLGVYINSKI